MYSGFTFTKVSGNLIGAHQKIDRVARRQLEGLLPACGFPSATNIIRFEGDQGPDSMKWKNPGIDEEWHFIQPFDKRDDKLIKLISYHYGELVKALREVNNERAAFEAAWVSHAIVDGLTPAHHYPYEQHLRSLRQGQERETRSTIKKKLILPGETLFKAIKNNWKMWGPRGLFTTHTSFELGFATLIAPMRFNNLQANTEQMKSLNSSRLNSWFRSVAQQVAKLNLYDIFSQNGWTLKFSGRLKRELAPILIDSVTTVWYSAYREANSKKSLSLSKA